MLEFLMNALVAVGSVIAILGLIAVMIFIFFCVDENVQEVTKHRRNTRFANKLFKRIEEYRNDFA